MRQLSMWIYYTHMLVLYPFILRGQLTGDYYNLYLVFGISSCIVLLESVILNNLKDLSGFKWLQNMIS